MITEPNGPLRKYYPIVILLASSGDAKRSNWRSDYIVPVFRLLCVNIAAKQPHTSGWALGNLGHRAKSIMTLVASIDISATTPVSSSPPHSLQW